MPARGFYKPGRTEFREIGNQGISLEIPYQRRSDNICTASPEFPVRDVFLTAKARLQNGTIA